MNAKHFAEQGGIVLRVAARLDVAGALIVCAAAIASGNVKIVVVARPRTESDPAAIVIGLRLIEREQRFHSRWVGDVGIAGNRKLRDVRDAVSESAA